MSKTGFVAPITPQTRGPTLIPENCEISFIHKEYKKFQVVEENNFVSLQDIVWHIVKLTEIYPCVTHAPSCHTVRNSATQCPSMLFNVILWHKVWHGKEVKFSKSARHFWWTTLDKLLETPFGSNQSYIKTFYFDSPPFFTILLPNSLEATQWQTPP